MFQPETNRSSAKPTRKKKLFDDSESDASEREDKVDMTPLHVQKAGNEGGRSGLVNKLFYKDAKEQVAPKMQPDP